MPGPPNICGLERYEFRDHLFLHMLQEHMAEANQPMPYGLKHWLVEAAQYVCCDVSLVRGINNIFKRGALIGYAWVRGTGSGVCFTPKAVVSSVAFFLSWEGASVVDARRRNAIVDQLASDIASIFSNTRLTLPDRATAVYDTLSRECAMHWVCAEGNQMCFFVDKECHNGKKSGSCTGTVSQVIP